MPHNAGKQVREPTQAVSNKINRDHNTETLLGTSLLGVQYQRCSPHIFALRSGGRFSIQLYGPRPKSAAPQPDRGGRFLLPAALPYPRARVGPYAA